MKCSSIRWAAGAGVRVALCVSLTFGPAVRADAQIPTSDLANLAQSVIKWIDDKLAAAQEYVQLVQEVITAKSHLEQVKLIYKKVMPYIENGKAYWDAGQAIERLIRTTESMKSYYESLQSTGRFSISKARTMLRMTSRWLEDIDDVQTLLKELLKVDNSLSQAERLEKIEEVANEAIALADALEAAVLEDLAACQQEISAECAGRMVDLAFGVDDSQQSAIQIDEDKALSDAEVLDTVSIDENPVSDAGGIFGLAYALIGALAALMMAWGYARYVKTGERQHQDALWKVFAGLIFVVLLMQIVQNVLF